MKRFEIITESDARVLDRGESVLLARGGRVKRVIVRGNLICRQGDARRPAALPDRVAAYAVAPHVHRRARGQVGQGESRLAVAAVGRSDQVEQGFVFADRKELPVARHPAGGSEVPGEHANLPDIRLAHRHPFLRPA